MVTKFLKYCRVNMNLNLSEINLKPLFNLFLDNHFNQNNKVRIQTDKKHYLSVYILIIYLHLSGYSITFVI